MATPTAHADRIDELMGRWLMQHDKFEVVRLGQAMRLPFTEVLTPAEIAVGQALMQAVSGIGILCGPVIVGQIAAAAGSLRPGMIVIGLFPVLFALTCLSLPETGPKAHARR